MQSTNNHSERRAAAFETLAVLTARWRADDRTTTTAGLTSALIQQGVLSLDELGLTSNHEFWDAAVEAGAVVRTRLDNGHWYVTLPDEQPPTQSQKSPAPIVVRSGEHSDPLSNRPSVRLRPDLWTAFVDWDTDYRRFWDRRHARAFLTPTAPGWTPSDVNPAYYVEVVPALQDTQLRWMRSFADKQQPAQRDSLHRAVRTDAPRGAFRRQLEALNLLRAWRKELAERIATVATEWATEAGIDLHEIFEAGTPLPQQDERRRVHHNERPTTAASSIRQVVSPHSAAQHDATEVLRGKLHRIVDQMTWVELSGLPVRAEHLLEP